MTTKKDPSKTQLKPTRKQAKSGKTRPYPLYMAPVKKYPLRPIRSEEELDRAIAILDELQGRPDELRPEEQDYLDCLSLVIEQYESEAYPMPAVSGPAILRYLMGEREENLSQLAEASGIALSTLSSILNGKRQLTLEHIKLLASHFGVEPAVFLD